MTPLKTTPEERLELGLETLHQRIHASYERHDACMGEPPDWQPRSDVVARVLDDLDTLAAEVGRLEAENAKLRAGHVALANLGAQVANIAECALLASILPGHRQFQRTVSAATLLFDAARKNGAKT